MKGTVRDRSGGGGGSGGMNDDALYADGGGGGGGRLRAGGWKRNIAIAGVAITSAPLVVPPLLLLSFVGVAFSVPFAVFFTGYACTQKIMGSLLPLPAPRLPSSPQAEQLLEEDSMAKEAEDAGRMPAEMVMYEHVDNSIEKERMGTNPTSSDKQQDERMGTSPTSSDKQQGGKGQREKKKLTEPLAVQVPQWGGNGEQDFREAGDIREEKDEQPRRSPIPPVETEDTAARVEENPEERIFPQGQTEKKREEGCQEDDEVMEETRATATADVGAIDGPHLLELEGLGGQVHAGASREEKKVENETAAPRSTDIVTDIVPDATSKEVRDAEQPGGTGEIQEKTKREAVTVPVGGTGMDRSGGLGERVPAVEVALVAVEQEIPIKVPSRSGEEHTTVAAETVACALDNTAVDQHLLPMLPQNVGYDSLIIGESSDLDENPLSNEEEKTIWNQIDAIRSILGYEAPRLSSCAEELDALYVLVGVDPVVESSTGLDDAKHKLRLLKSIIGVE